MKLYVKCENKKTSTLNDFKIAVKKLDLHKQKKKEKKCYIAIKDNLVKKEVKAR